MESTDTEQDQSVTEATILETSKESSTKDPSESVPLEISSTVSTSATSEAETTPATPVSTTSSTSTPESPAVVTNTSIPSDVETTSVASKPLVTESSSSATPPPYLYQTPESGSGITGYTTPAPFPAFPGSQVSTTWKPASTPDFVLGPGACMFDGKVYVSAQQIQRDDPCDFCFCFRGDIICLQQSCPPPVPGCFEEPIAGFCCPRYECPVTQAIVNFTTTTTPIPTYPPVHRQEEIVMCEIGDRYYHTGEIVEEASGPCLECRLVHFLCDVFYVG